MTERELKKLNRAELLELLLEQTKRVEELETQFETLNKQFNNRRIDITEAGSIAQAALRINNVFEATQAAAVQYLENVALLSGRQEEVCAKREEASREAARQLLKYTYDKCLKMEEETQRKCKEMIAATQREMQNGAEKPKQSSSEENATVYETLLALLDKRGRG